MIFKNEEIESALAELGKGFDSTVLSDLWDIAFGAGENLGYDEGYNDGQASGESW